MDYKFYAKFWFRTFWSRKNILTAKANSLYEINYKALYSHGVKCMVYDIDDAIGEHKGVIPQKTQKLFKDLQSQGYKIALFSNSSRRRKTILNKVFENSGVYIVQRSDKPNPDGFQEVLSHFNLRSNEAAVVGDKLGTDMFGGYLANYSQRILVKPFSSVFGGKSANIAMKFVRFLENLGA
jgi:HAD superfamily phosphatase (TIGR01668 family)